MGAWGEGEREGGAGRDGEPTAKFAQGKLATCTREDAVSNAEDHMDVAGGRVVGDGKGRMMMFLYFLFFVGGVGGHVSVRDVKCMMIMKEPDSGSYWYESTVFAGVRSVRTGTCE